MVDLRAVVNIEDMHDTAVLIDPIDDAIGTSPSAVTADERPEQGFADPLRVDRQSGIAELQRGGGNGWLRYLFWHRALTRP